MATTDTRVVLWAAAAVAACAAVAVAVGTSAGARPAALSDDDIANALAADGPPSPTSADPGAVVAQGSGATIFDAVPGSVTARCEEGLATLQTWTPHPGYQAVSFVRGPGPQVSVRFESDAKVAVLVSVTCVDGRPSLQVGGANAGAGSVNTGAGTGAGVEGPGAEPGSGMNPGSGTGSGSGSGAGQGSGPAPGPDPAPAATTAPPEGGGDGGGGGGGGGNKGPGGGGGSGGGHDGG